MKLSEIRTLDQLQLELFRNGFTKADKDPFSEEDFAPKPNYYAINYISVAVPCEWGYEPRSEIIIAPNQSIPHFIEQHIKLPPYEWDDKFFVGAIAFPSIESIQDPSIIFDWPKWKWGEGRNVKDNYPSGVIEQWIVYDLNTKSTISDIGNEIDIDNFEKTLSEFIEEEYKLREII